MSKITIVEDCLAPARFVYLEYSGKNPFGVANKIASMLCPFFHVSSAGISETDFRWDTSGDPITFYFTWWVQRSEETSSYTKQRFDIKVQGKQGKETKDGEFTLQLSAKMQTSFGGKSSITKALFWLYDYLFYKRRRAEYLKNCEELTYEFRDEIKKHFNLSVIDKGG